MREFLYRGKDPYIEAWVYGHYVTGVLEHYIIPVRDFGCADLMWSQVDPESVGESTGMLDKNGKLIFEGDIVKDDRLGIFGEVVWMGRNPSFAIKNITGETVYNDDFWGDLEIVGTAYDSGVVLEVTGQGFRRSANREKGEP